MNIRDSLKLILTDYPIAKGQELAKHPLAKTIRGRVPGIVKSAVEEPDRYTFKGSVGQGLWADAPWVAIFDILITDTVRRGYYPVYLFREDFSGLYLSLNQGVTDIRNKYPKPKKALKTKAADYRAQIGGLPPGFPDASIDLRPSASSKLSAFYEAGNICAKFYDTNNLPSEEDLVFDLRSLLQVYEILSYNETVPVGTAATDEEANLYVEDLRKFRQHKRVERNAKLAKEAKRIHGYTCKLCSFNFEKAYGAVGHKYIEAHHLTPLSKLKGLKLLLDPSKDFTVLCANCHRMVHRCEFPHDIESFREKYLSSPAEV
jgi:5-methylcytosine-specific restriction protein A